MDGSEWGDGGERVHANRHAGLASVEVMYNTSAAATTTQSLGISLQEQGLGSSAAEGNPGNYAGRWIC